MEAKKVSIIKREGDDETLPVEVRENMLRILLAIKGLTDRAIPQNLTPILFISAGGQSKKCLIESTQ